MDQLVFRNKGLLDLNCIRLMGVSVKDTKSSIGFFGTGLKFAIATILRLGGDVSILTQDGGVFKKYRFDTKHLTVRDKDFSQVTMDDEPLGFTTELGRQWEAWMAIREIYSNCLDEGGDVIYQEPILQLVNPAGREQRTWIIITGDLFVEIWKNKNDYFIDPERLPAHSTPFVHSYEKENEACRGIFYKGILVGEFPYKTLYAHNLQAKIDLTEDRSVKYTWQAAELLEKTIITSNDEAFVRKCLLTHQSFEGQLPFTDSHHSLDEKFKIEPSEVFRKVCHFIAKQRPRDVCLNAVTWLEKRTRELHGFEECPISDVQKMQVDRALSCLNKMGFGEEISRYPMRFMNWLGEGVYGRAMNNEILISKECFDLGTKFLTSTILEEYVHNRYGYKDHSRELQTWLFDRLITMAEEHVLKAPV